MQFKQSVIAGLFLLCSVTQLLAQSADIPQPRPSDEPLIIELPEAGSKSPILKAPDPQLNQPSQIKKKTNELTFILNKIVLSGNHVLSDQDLLDSVRHYLGKLISSADIRIIQLQLTNEYIQRGYINSGAILPDQAIVDGVVQYQLIEGQLSTVKLQGNLDYDDDYLIDRIYYNIENVLQVDQLEQNLRHLQLNPGIESLQADLQPGTGLGESILNLGINEADQKQLDFSLDNYSSPSVGEAHAGIQFTHRNLFGGAETFIIGGEKTKGLDKASLRLSVPLAANDLSIFLAHNTSDADIVEEPFDLLDIASETRTTTLGLDIPLRRRHSNPQNLTIELEKRFSRTDLLGTPFSFSEGFENGKARVSAIRLSYDWKYYLPTKTFAMRSKLSSGIDAADSTINKDLADSRFISFINQFIYFQRSVDGRFQAIVRNDLQLSNDRLLSIEQFSLGGANSVRGYRENQIVSDRAVVLSGELRYRPTNSDLWLTTFVDYGKAENSQRELQGKDEIYSVGLGLIWNFSRLSQLVFEWAEPLKDISNNNDSLQEDGIHLSIKSAIRF